MGGTARAGGRGDSAATAGLGRVLVIGGFAESMLRFRGPLLSALRQAGSEVHAAAPGLHDAVGTADGLRALGVAVHDAPLSRAGLNPAHDLRAFLALVRLMRRVRPERVLSYTIKPVIWGTLAAWMAGVPHRYALVTGLGYAFTGEARGKRRIVRQLARGLYALALRRAELVFFQNPDDAALFRELGLVPGRLRLVVVNGSGIDTAEFAPAPLPDRPVRFLLIARLLGDKGIREYAAAAAEVRRMHPEVTFHLVGGRDENPDALSAGEVEAWQAAGTLAWHGALRDVRPAIAAAHVYVLPSYREGTPRTVLEAMSMGRPIITTDAPGCRETVVDGENGFLVPVADPAALARAMLRFIEEPALIPAMGAAARRIAEARYDVHKVNAAMLQAMDP